MQTALRIDVDMTVSLIELPEDASASYAAIRSMIGGAVNQGVYHQRALLHIYDSAVAETPLNVAAWTLPSAWRGMSLYPLHGTIVVTGRDSAGEACGLDQELVQQAQAVVAMVADTVRKWQQRPPASNEAAAQELLAYAARELAAV